MPRPYDDWKTTAPDCHSPDPPEDTEAKEEIGRALIEAVYFAAEEGSPYQGKRGQFGKLLRLVADAIDHEEATAEEPIIDRKAEARDILALEIKHFGRGWFGQPWEVKPGNPVPAWQDARLLELRNWLNREREVSQ